jgi:hypothetical protein
LVICRQAGQGIEIVRVLHAHQNLSAYLQAGKGSQPCGFGQIHPEAIPATLVATGHFFEH